MFDQQEPTLQEGLIIALDLKIANWFSRNQTTKFTILLEIWKKEPLYVTLERVSVPRSKFFTFSIVNWVDKCRFNSSTIWNSNGYGNSGFRLFFETVINDFPLHTRRMECELTNMYERSSFCQTNLAGISFFQNKFSL